MPADPRPRAAPRHVLLGAMLVLGLLACAIDRAGKVDVQQWMRSRGPVVPHDTFPADCRLCHEGEGWSAIRKDFRFDHMAETGSALEGAHAAAECLRCHNDRGPVQVFASRGCAGCHADVHRGQLGPTCGTCHGMEDWRPAGPIAMHNRTRFPLVGAHAATACFRCHPGAEAGHFTRTPIECLACHADDLARAEEPDHQVQGWVDDCQRCHIPTSWSGGGFNHSAFPLTGAHKSAACSACHAGGVYAGTPDRCVDCHLAEYQATTMPSHVAAGFPTSCQQCHNTSAWQPASFQHSFPITSGKHQGFACVDCHLQPTNFQRFSCTHCHEHSQKEMDDEHEDVPGYVWESGACYACHPQGKESALAPPPPPRVRRQAPPPGPARPRPEGARRLPSEARDGRGS